MYAPDDKFISDFWILREGEDYHLFHLQAPRALVDPDLRHANHTIGHAVSKDLIHWTPLVDALVPDPSLPHEGSALATGSVIRRGCTFSTCSTWGPVSWASASAWRPAAT